MKPRVWMLTVFLFTAAAGLSGCLFVLDRSSSYQGIVGSEFATRNELHLLKMSEHQFEFVPYRLASSRISYGGYATFIETVPAGARIKVLEAKFRSNLDAGFDYLICDLFIPNRSTPVRIEQLIGSPKNAAGIERVWSKLK